MNITTYDSKKYCSWFVFRSDIECCNVLRPRLALQTVIQVTILSALSLPHHVTHSSHHSFLHLRTSLSLF